VASRHAIDRVYRERQVALAELVARRLGVTLGSLASLDELELARYVATAHPVVAGGQYAAANGGAGYVTALVSRTDRARRNVVDVAGALTRSGVLVTPESRSIVAPVLRARRLVGEGEAYPVALEAAQAYASSLSSLDLQAAQRVGVGEGARASEAAVEGWEKDVGPDACSWCAIVAGTVYDDPEAVPFHDNDKCSVIPALEAGTSEYVYTEDDIPF
jgi:hypothetical protein